MSDSKKDVILSDATGAIVEGTAKILFDLGALVVASILSRNETRKKKLLLLQRRSVDSGWNYGGFLIQNYIKRRYVHYTSKEDVTLSKIRKEIERPKIARNVIITGQPGVGKTIALKWLFLNTYVEGYQYIYLSSRMFIRENSIEDVSKIIEKAIEGIRKCIIFFDGLDELKCLKGCCGELENFLRIFNLKNQRCTADEECKFVISSRPEHFDFHRMIIKKESLRTLDNYIVYEVLPLNKKESYQACKMIKQLKKFDDVHGFQHFEHKWPAKDDKSAVSEREYLFNLKQYIDTEEGSVLLSSPLLCRYAYPTVQDWILQRQRNQKEELSTYSSRIGRIITNCIKWEFHDQNEFQTENGQGLNSLEEFKAGAFGFLEQIAFAMGKDDSISVDEWRKMKDAQRISVNASLSILHDFEGRLVFVHESFREFFLSRYFVRNMCAQPEKDTFSKFLDYTNSSLIFTTMYIEQMLHIGVGTPRLICDYILSNDKSSSIDRLTKFARGELRYYFTDQQPFTIEEFIIAFPAACVEYAGCFFDYTTMDQLAQSGILEVNDPQFLECCNVNTISRIIAIKGIRITKNIPYTFRMITLEFMLYDGNTQYSVGGYWRARHYSNDDLSRLVRQTGMTAYFSHGKYSIDAIQNDPALSRLLFYKKMRDYAEHKEEQEKLTSWVEVVIKFFGNDKSFWGFFDGHSINVYETSESNVRHLHEHFMRGIEDKPIDYIVLYGHYKACFYRNALVPSDVSFKKLNQIVIDFFTYDLHNHEAHKGMSLYYHMHWKNHQAFEIKRSKANNSSEENEEFLLTVSEVLELTSEAEGVLKESDDDRLRLIISDEKLLLYYLLREGEKMVELAFATLPLCLKHQHVAGIQFREFLMDSETMFNGRDFQEAYQYCSDYLWI